MRTNCIVKLLKLKIFELNTLVHKETSDHVEGKPPPSDTYLNAYLTNNNIILLQLLLGYSSACNIV
jgi:hypothetical protein